VKTKVSPLALGGVCALCLAVLFFAWWTLSSPDSAPEPEPDLQSAADATPGGDHPDASQATASKKPSASELDSTRVALAGEEKIPDKPQVEFEIRSSTDRPLANARTLLRRGEEVFGSKRCDESGVTRYDAASGHAELIVIARDVPPFTREVPLAAGHQLIVVERGLAVSGRVRVARERPVGGIELTLTSDRPLVDDSAWPEAVRGAFELGERDKLRLVTHTSDSGAFEFIGLASPWSGKLEVGETHQLLAVTGGIWSQGSESIRLDDPVEGLVLDLVALELARGHVVASVGGPGVARASVNGVLNFEPSPGDDEGANANFEGRTDASGFFSLPIHRRGGFDTESIAKGIAWPPLRSASLTLDGGDEIPRRRLELAGAQLPENFDFGELVLERGATLQFAVSDAQSKPLAGAYGRLDGERSAPTDETGHASIVYAPGTGRPLMVTLDGYRDARADLPKEASEVLAVVLERTNRLTVVVSQPDGRPAIGILVQLTGQRAQPQPRRGRGNRVNEQRTDEQGRAVFSDMVPGSPLSITVRDAMGASVAERATTLAADEWATLELSIPRALLSFSGVVRDELGLALAEAGIEFTDMQNPNRANVSARSDADGRFAFAGLSNPIGLLRVRKSGFAPLTVPEFQIPPPGVIADIRLERGLRLTLRMVDSRGAPVRGENLRLDLAGERPSQGRRISDNEWEFSNLPRIGMVAVGSAGNREYRQDVEPLNGNQDFLVPVQGGLEVTLRLDPSLLQSTLNLSLRARDDRRVRLSQNLSGEPLQTRTFAPMLPGEYQLSVTQYVPDGQRGTWIALGAVQKVTVTEGANQRLEISR